jgi:hypothetical protein
MTIRNKTFEIYFFKRIAGKVINMLNKYCRQEGPDGPRKPAKIPA